MLHACTDCSNRDTVVFAPVIVSDAYDIKAVAKTSTPSQFGVVIFIFTLARISLSDARPGKRSGSDNIAKKMQASNIASLALSGWNELAMYLYLSTHLFLRNRADVPPCFRFLCQGAWACPLREPQLRRTWLGERTDVDT